MKKLLFNFTFVILVLTLLSSCSTAYKLKKENKKYDKFTTGFRNSAYTLASENGVSKIVKDYNKSNSSDKITDADVHSYIGFLMLLGRQNRFAAAEANLILSGSANIVNNYAAQNIISAVKKNKDWRLSAEKNEDAAKMIEDSNPEIDGISFSNYSSELIQAYVHFQDRDFVAASGDFARLSSVTGYIWPSTLSNMFANIQNNNKDEAYKIYEELLKDEETPEKVKVWLRENAPELIEKPKKLNDIGSSIDKIIRIYINGKFTIEAAKGVKAVAESCFDAYLFILGGLK